MVDNVVILQSDLKLVNLIKLLFSRHQHSASTETVWMNWPGRSGKEYAYQVYPLDTSFEPLPGNYIYAKQDEEGRWIPIYIAQTRDLRQRLEGHVGVEDARQNGATHVHAHYSSAGQSARCTEERDLLLRWQPVCNEPLEA